jgi:hypothetical protein
VGYQCLGEVAGSLPSLPPARLRLHTTRLALTTLVTPSCLAIQVRFSEVDFCHRGQCVSGPYSTFVVHSAHMHYFIILIFFAMKVQT